MARKEKLVRKCICFFCYSRFVTLKDAVKEKGIKEKRGSNKK